MLGSQAGWLQRDSGARVPAGTPPASQPQSNTVAQGVGRERPRHLCASGGASRDLGPRDPGPHFLWLLCSRGSKEFVAIKKKRKKKHFFLSISFVTVVKYT